MKPILVIHGGAGEGLLKAERRDRLRKSISSILASVYPRLARGLSAVDAVVEAVRLLEDEPQFNAGRGSKVQADGRIRMSAALMNGFERRFSGCVNVEGLRNPVRLARRLQSEKDRVLGGKGAKQYARLKGLEFRSAMTKDRKEEFLRGKKGKTGTVGAVALDRKGRLAAATSTGGKGFEIPHRVSDSPTVAGCFANAHAAISATGIGEQIVEFSVASAIATLAEAGIPLSESSARLIRQAKSRGAEFGFIAVDNAGVVTAAKTTRTMIWGQVFENEIFLGF